MSKKGICGYCGKKRRLYTFIEGAQGACYECCMANQSGPFEPKPPPSLPWKNFQIEQDRQRRFSHRKLKK